MATKKLQYPENMTEARKLLDKSYVFIESDSPDEERKLVMKYVEPPSDVEAEKK